MSRVIINMQNPNTLVSLAYIKTNSNPLSVFCNYVLYLLLTAPDQSLRSDELKQKLADRFGLNMPQQMINNCIRILKRGGDVIQLPAGAGYSIGTTNFNADTFEKNLLRLQEQEIAVLQSIVAFVYDTYKINWSVDDAKNYLSAFLDEEGNGARLFLYESAQTDSKKVSPSWYIARYVSNMQQKEDGIEKKYLEDIVNGMMIYQGIYQTNDYQQNKGQKFKGTVFYLDTKLILRALGYSWDAQVQATRELITLITKKYEGKVGVFQQTVSEVENALSRAGYNYTHDKPIMDLELKMYAELNPTGASLLSEASTSVLAQLKKEFDIDPPASFDWNTSECRAHSIDVQGIINYIKSEHEWRSGAISNDVEIINQINILRKSDYSIRYGGKSKLPVFLTTNTDLVFTLRKYISETLESGATTKWNIHALPIISDNMVLFRLWVPYANEYTNLPSLTLSRYAYAAQNPNTQFFEKLRATATAYKDEKGVDLINLSEVRRQQLEDILVTKTQGDSDELTEEIVALSVEELIKMQNISLHSRIGNLEGKIGAQNTEIEKRDTQIIKLAAKPYVNKLGVWRPIIYFAKLWWIVTVVAFAIITSLSELYANESFTFKWAIIFFPVVIQILLEIIDKFFEEKNFSEFAMKLAVRAAWKHYSCKIISDLSEDELIYKDQILDYCLLNTPILLKYRQYCNHTSSDISYDTAER